MDIILFYLIVLSVNCLLNVFLVREIKMEKKERSEMKIKILSWSLILLNFVSLLVSLYVIYSKKIKVNCK